MDIKQRIEEIYPELVEIRRDFHRHPEPGFEEKWTSARIRELLDGWGISYEYPVAGETRWPCGLTWMPCR